MSRIIRECSFGIRRTDPLSLWRGRTRSAGLGELQGVGIRAISASFWTGDQRGIGGASGSFGVTGGQGYDWEYGGAGNRYGYKDEHGFLNDNT